MATPSDSRQRGSALGGGYWEPVDGTVYGTARSVMDRFESTRQRAIIVTSRRSNRQVLYTYVRGHGRDQLAGQYRERGQFSRLAVALGNAPERYVADRAGNVRVL